jgi:peptidoglycan-associated lipoprotein
MALGERRGMAVQRYLVLQGVSPAQLEVVSYGKERPVATGSDEESWAQNRRVNLVK